MRPLVLRRCINSTSQPQKILWKFRQEIVQRHYVADWRDLLANHRGDLSHEGYTYSDTNFGTIRLSIKPVVA